jgi:hypothetical protein
MSWSAPAPGSEAHASERCATLPLEGTVSVRHARAIWWRGVLVGSIATLLVAVGVVTLIILTICR